MVDYNKRLVEVDEVLNYLSEEDLLKIPEDIRQVIKDNKDKEYTWEYDTSKEFKDQNLNRDTIIILSYLNMEYLLNEEQKRLMQQIYELNERNLEKSKEEKYNHNNIFKNKNAFVQTKRTEDTEQTSLVQYESIPWYRKIFNKIKVLLKI